MVPQPTLTAAPSIPQGSTMAFTGTGFTPNATVTVTGPAGTTPVAVTADASGAIAGSLDTTGLAIATGYTLTAADGVSTLDTSAAPTVFAVTDPAAVTEPPTDPATDPPTTASTTPPATTAPATAAPGATSTGSSGRQLAASGVDVTRTLALAAGFLLAGSLLVAAAYRRPAPLARHLGAKRPPMPRGTA
jgi:hypothetical protein